MKKRFLEKVKKVGSCWIWQAGYFNSGYGAFYFKKKICLAHRVSFELFVGPIEDRLFVLHFCDNKKCVNPSHLFLGTQADNVRDRDAKGRTAHNNGEKNPMAKLKSKQVVEIRKLYSRGNISQDKLGKLFNICQNQVSEIVLREQWSHI